MLLGRVLVALRLEAGERRNQLPAGIPRPDHLVEIDLIHAVDLGRDLEWGPGPAGDLDRLVGPFLRTDPPQEGEIAA